MANKNFAVVDFYKEELVDFVPWTWISGSQCAWPTLKGKPLTTAQIKLKENVSSVPQEDWFWYPVKVIKSCGKLSNYLHFIYKL